MNEKEIQGWYQDAANAGNVSCHQVMTRMLMEIAVQLARLNKQLEEWRGQAPATTEVQK